MTNTTVPSQFSRLSSAGSVYLWCPSCFGSKTKNPWRRSIPFVTTSFTRLFPCAFWLFSLSVRYSLQHRRVLCGPLYGGQTVRPYQTHPLGPPHTSGIISSKQLRRHLPFPLRYSSYSYTMSSPIGQRPVCIVFDGLFPATQPRHIHVIEVATDNFQTKRQ